MGWNLLFGYVCMIIPIAVYVIMYRYTFNQPIRNLYTPPHSVFDKRNLIIYLIITVLVSTTAMAFIELGLL